jgi:hypothetical protein
MTIGILVSTKVSQALLPLELPAQCSLTRDSVRTALYVDETSP